MLIPALILAFCAVVIVIAGIRLASLADELAERTGLGEAFMGALFLGGTTSLPGITASVAAAADGRGEMALANALGGIAIQTVFIVVADIVYRDANLEHAAASEAVLIQSALLITLLSMLLFACLGPQFTIGHLHPVTLLLPAAYLLGLRAIRGSHTEPMWTPRQTWHTPVRHTPAQGHERSSTRNLWLRLIAAGLLCVAAGWVLTRSTEVLADVLGLSESVAGGFITGVTTSFPELVIAIAAVRSGALTLAVAGIIGGNAFDTLFAAIADVAYVEGSIYGAATQDTLVLLTLALLMNAVLLLGLLRRQTSGLANVGFEGVLVLLLYGGGALLLTVA